MPILKRKLPGLTNYDPITMSRGGTNTNFLFDWRKATAAFNNKPGVHDGEPAGDTGGGFRSTVRIQLFDKGFQLSADPVR